VRKVYLVMVRYSGDPSSYIEGVWEDREEALEYAKNLEASLIARGDHMGAFVQDTEFHPESWLVPS
jgi:hypothetical protein